MIQSINLENLHNLGSPGFDLLSYSTLGLITTEVF